MTAGPVYLTTAVKKPDELISGPKTVFLLQFWGGILMPAVYVIGCYGHHVFDTKECQLPMKGSGRKVVKLQISQNCKKVNGTYIGR